MSDSYRSLGKTIVCSACYGAGGLGQHFAQIVENSRQEGLLDGYYTPSTKAGDTGHGHVVFEHWSPWLFQYTPARFSAGWKSHLGGDIFDRTVAKYLQAGIKEYIGFGGQSLHSFRQARKLGAERLGLVAANSHVKNVVGLHAQAHKQYPIEESWLNAAQVQKTLKEYDMADIIYVASEYTRQTFLAEGFPERKLSRVNYETLTRYKPTTEASREEVFRIVCTGSMTVVKGIPVLLEAFSRLGGLAELTLVGGWASRGMRHYLLGRIAQDPRIRLAPGDPLPHLQQANVCVHPSYEDGYAYAPMEALACGVPVIVTEDTGMKEHVREGVNGYVVPTGSWEAVLERLQQLRQTPLKAVAGAVALG